METKEAIKKLIREKLSQLSKKELLRLAQMHKHVEAKRKRVTHKAHQNIL